jgi:hypothetical protein
MALKTRFSDVEGDWPVSWLGYSLAFKPKLVIRVCSWCPDKDASYKIAKAEKLGVTDTICPSCFQAQQEREHP